MAEQVQIIDAATPPAALFASPSNAILVGGQALALWVSALNIPLPAALEAGVTYDVDYLGSRADAEAHFDLLETSFRGGALRAELRFPEPFEPTPNTAKITVFNGDAIAGEIDYLGAVIGYVGPAEIALRRRAIPIDWPGAHGSLQVMHPFDCVQSRVHNLYALPSKRNPFHLAQTRLSLQVLKTYLSQTAATETSPRKILLPIAEEVIDLAHGRAGVFVHDHWEIDVLDAIPAAQYPSEFVRKRYGQAVRYAERCRNGRRGGRIRPFRGPISAR